VASASCVVVLLAGGLIVVTGSVAAAAMSAQGVNFSTLEVTIAVQPVGTFTDTTPSPANGYTVSIDWGDGNTTAGFATSIGNGTFEVDGPSIHSYATDGTYTVTFSITETGDDHDAATGTAIATVLEANRGIFVSTSPLTASEGTTVSGTIATFTDPGATDPPTNFTPTVNWGDGTTTTGTVTAGSGPGAYVVNGTHTYTDELSGSYSVGVSEPEGGGNNPDSTNTVTISEADALTATGSSFSATAGTPFTGTVATFTDTNSAALASDFATTINWGDGTTTAGAVTGPTGGPFTVTGSHTYKPAGTFHVSVTATDDGLGTATATATATATVTHGHRNH
jgi:hypothetical protein